MKVRKHYNTQEHRIMRAQRHRKLETLRERDERESLEARQRLYVLKDQDTWPDGHIPALPRYRE